MKTFKEIIVNQKTFKNQILLYLRNELNESKDELKSIKTSDDYIMSQKKKMEKAFKQAKFRKSFDELFFMHPRRNKENFVWWDETKQEALILKYEKK
jgi:hypothetical protein